MQGTVQVGKYDFDKSEWKGVVEGEAVEMSLIKAGGERVDETGTTGTNTGETTIHAVFHLYKEQPIDFKAKLVSNPMIVGSKRVEWDEVRRTARYNGEKDPRTNAVDFFIALKIPEE